MTPSYRLSNKSGQLSEKTGEDEDDDDDGGSSSSDGDGDRGDESADEYAE